MERHGEINVLGRKMVCAETLRCVKAWGASKNWKLEENESGLRWDQRNGQELYHTRPCSL